MPIYTYQCDDCGVRFDARQKFADDPLEECPECGGRVHRVPQPVGVVFKGSGWYAKDNKLAAPGKREDSASEKPEANASKPGDAEPKSSNGGASASDSTPAKKSDD